jgi:pimeloyl-ACP methyl ester carboxylesterase
MGQPLVLVHGMWCNASHLALLHQLFSARTYDCLSITLPAHQPSATQAAEVAALSIRDYASHVEREIQARGFSHSPVLVGHSMGGLIAQIVATRLQPTALVLLTPAAPAGINALHPKVIPAALPIFSRSGFWKRPHRMSAERLRRCGVNGLHVTQQEKIIQSLVFESGRAVSEMAFWWADPAHSTRVDPAAVSCPVYVVSAGQDGLTPPSVVKKVAGRYAQATHRHWPDRGHWVIDDADTEDMVVEIDGWLRPILQRARRTPVILPKVTRAT